MLSLSFFPRKYLQNPENQNISDYLSSFTHKKVVNIRDEITQLLLYPNLKNLEVIPFVEKSYSLMDISYLYYSWDWESAPFISDWKIHEKFGPLLWQYLTSGLGKQARIQGWLWSEMKNKASTDSSLIFPGKQCIYEVCQSIHGDISIAQCQLSGQEELFKKNWEPLWDKPTNQFQIYQETSYFICSLLSAYALSWKWVNHLVQAGKQMEDFQQKSCAAADSGSKESDVRFLTRLLRESLEKRDQDLPNSVSVGNIYGWGQNFLGAEFYKNSNTLKIGNYTYLEKSRTNTFHTKMEIDPLDIPNLLCALHMFPGRSGNTALILLEEALALLWYTEES